MRKKTARLFPFGLVFFLGVAFCWPLAAEGKMVGPWPEPGRIEPILFQPTTEEQKGLARAIAVTGQPDGCWGSRGGPSVYLEQAEQPLEIYWPQPARAGAEGALAEGYGEMSLKNAGDGQVLERYRGEFRQGFREGRGELLGRDVYGDGAFFYQGDFHQGRLEGRGLYFGVDFREGGEAPFVYEGEFQDNTFHGQGVMRELVTGRVIHDGFWFEGFPFKGEAKKWARADRRSGSTTGTRLAANPGPAKSAGSR